MNVAPGVKIGTLKFLGKFVLVTYIDVLKRAAPDLLPNIVKVLDDKDSTVRDQACHVMGLMKARLPEAMTEKELKNVVKQKLEKIEEAAKDVKPSKYDREENWKPPAKKPAKKAAAPADDELMTFDSAPPKKKPPPGIGKKPVKKAADPEEEEKTGGDDDELMTFSNDAPVSKPPPNIGKKPVKKKAPADDEEMKDETAAAPAKKGPPALSSSKPAAAKGPTKAPTGPVIVEEDIGSGYSAEEAAAKAAELWDASVLSGFEEAKWQDKLASFTALNEAIAANESLDDKGIEATCKFVKAKMKDWKESNLNLIKGAIGTFKACSEKDTMSKRAFAAGASFFVDKCGDVKYAALIKEMVPIACEVLGPKFVMNQLLKHAAKAKAPNVFKEVCNMLIGIYEEFGAAGTPLKEVIDFGQLAASQTNAQVREAALKLFCELYKHLGSALETFMTEIKASTLKTINDAMASVEVYGKGDFTPTRQLRGAAAAAAVPAGPGKKGAGGGGGGGGGVADLLADMPRENITKKLTSKLLEQFKHKDPKIRMKVPEQIEAILKEAKMRIEAEGIGELMDCLKQGMKEANMAALRGNIGVLGLLAEAVGQPIGKYQKKCLVPMIE